MGQQIFRRCCLREDIQQPVQEITPLQPTVQEIVTPSATQEVQVETLAGHSSSTQAQHELRTEHPTVNKEDLSLMKKTADNDDKKEDLSLTKGSAKDGEISVKNRSIELGLLSGFHCLDRTTIKVDRASSVQSLIRKHAGYKINFPAGCVQQSVTVEVATAMTGLFEFPENTSPVSAIIHVHVKSQTSFEKPVTLELEHCCIIESEDEASSLSFAVADTSAGVFPYRFQLVPDGKFSCRNRYGTISVPKFSIWVILRSTINAAWTWLASGKDQSDSLAKQPSTNGSGAPRSDNLDSQASMDVDTKPAANGLQSPDKVPKLKCADVSVPAQRYVAYIFCLPAWGRTFTLRVIFGIVQDLALCCNALVTKVTKNEPYKEYDSFLVTFDKHRVISLERVEEGEIVRGWKIQSSCSTEIQQNEVDNLDGSDHSILAKCTKRFSIIWQEEGPPEILDHRIKLNGTEPQGRYFHLIHDPFEGLPSQEDGDTRVYPRNPRAVASVVTFEQLISRAGVSKDFFDREFSPEHFVKISALLPNWLKYAEALGLSDLQIFGIKTDVHLDVPMRAKEVLRVWHQSNGFKATYSRFIEVCLEQKHTSLAETVCKMLKGVL